MIVIIQNLRIFRLIVKWQVNSQKTARAYFDDLNIPVEIVHLTGSVELGPITGMAEAIIDLVATGKTLKENGLSKIDDLFYSTARLIANPLSLRLDRNPLRDVILSIESSKDILDI